ncbi:SAM-dependent methyltransferase [Antrihabitans cavernicola]|uniref:SAM-dependent methyltransferase n=1 Tax=Antrihabitans cavernicola TaxID=2495913 RepID=A0A5A7SE55_9NOCA|nr:SAM-dependent methyltransferase [Spelaeibacter cavernicola]KAA0022903.1 hypothetical protein FOY51_10345 [Spelaeibacter cavernicola]
MTQPDWAPADIDPAIPSVARVYDYVVGGMHNFEVDRQLADRAEAMWPVVPQILRANRAFLRRAVTMLGEAGITQFLDIGSGIPTAGNVHEIAQSQHPDAKVVYVDTDPVAVTHSQAILAGNPNATAVRADFNDVDAVLAHPEVIRLIDFTQPVAVLLVALLHFIPDESNPGANVAKIRNALPPGSYLAITHFSNEGPADKVAQFIEMSRETPNPLTLRSQAEISGFLGDFDILEPGVVYLPLWRPESPEDVGDHPERLSSFAGVGLKPPSAL